MRITYFAILEDIKNEYTKLRQDGQNRDQAVQVLIARYHDELTIGAEDDGLLFWIGLADAQYALKELSGEVSTRGLAALEQLKVAVPEITPSDIEKRSNRYALAPMQERAQVRKPKRFRCQWRIGDTFAYQVSGEKAEASGIAGDYVLLRKVDELETDGRITPVVTLTHWKNGMLPCSEAEFQSVPILRLCNGRLNSPKSSYEYRIEMLFTRQRQIEDLGLLYLGNFTNISMPANEFYCREPGCVLMLSPQKLDEELSFYCGTLQSYYEAQKEFYHG